MWKGDGLNPEFARQIEPEVRALGRLCLSKGEGWFVYVLRVDDEAVFQVHHLGSVEIQSPVFERLKRLDRGYVGVLYLGEGSMMASQRPADSLFDSVAGVA